MNAHQLVGFFYWVQYIEFQIVEYQCIKVKHLQGRSPKPLSVIHWCGTI